jgi:hypothetical protein
VIKAEFKPELFKLASRASDPVDFKQDELVSPYRVLSSESGMYHLLNERVSTVTIEFLQYRARVRIGLNRTGIERVVEQTGLFTSLVVGMRRFKVESSVLHLICYSWYMLTCHSLIGRHKSLICAKTTISHSPR